MKYFFASLVALASLFVVTAHAASGPSASGPYDEAADAQAQVAAAFAAAKTQNRNAMIVFGANWCGDCKMLDGEFKKPALAALLDKQYVVVKVDVGRFNKNLDVVKPYGEVIKKGIPSIVIVTPANELVYATNGGELADARKMGEAGVAAFFQNLATRK